MKWIILSTLFLLMCRQHLFSQHAAESIPYAYCSDHSTPLLFLKGQIINVPCDSMYLLNKSRYLFYKTVHNTILNQRDSVTHQLLVAYETQLAEQHKIFDALLKNSKEAETLSLNTIQDSRTILVNTEITLANTQKKLDGSLLHLGKAKEEIRKARWAAAGKKVLIGAGGLVAGLLLGLLITH